jgi:RecB family exonuclease
MPNDQKTSSLRLSVSKVKTFSDCQKKYHFSYILKLPRKEFDYHTFGQFVHKILELFYEQRISGNGEPNSDLMGKVFKTAMSEYGHRLSSDHKKEGYEIIDRYLQRLAKGQDEAKKVLSVEKRFNLNITDNVILNGMIDKVQIDNDGVMTVADYKTTKNKKYLKDDFLQLQTYAYVLWSEDKSIKKVRGAYVLLRHDFERIEKEFSIDEIMEVKNKYETYAKNIEDELLWRANPTRLCAYCEFLDSCNEGKSFVNPLIVSGENKWV